MRPRSLGRLAAATLLAGLSAVDLACFDQFDPAGDDLGFVQLAVFMRGADADVELLQYEISGNGIRPIEGASRVAAETETASLRASGLPVGPGYWVRLEARSNDGGTVCKGAIEVEAVASSDLETQVVLVCRMPGPIDRDGAFRSCPAVESYALSSLAVRVGESVDIEVLASDRDADEVLQFSWTDTGGAFTQADQARTQYRCLVPGERVIGLSVYDGWCMALDGLVLSCAP